MITFGRGALVLAVSLVVGSACSRGIAEQAAPTVPPPSAPPCPDEMSLVTSAAGEVCVDRYEGAIADWPFSHPLDGREAGTFRAMPAQGIKPQVNISEEQAEAACRASSKRLCTSQEWLTACRGPKAFVYPYGKELVPGACNVGRPRPAAANATSEDRLDDPRLAEGNQAIEAGGAFPKCVSAFGIFDLHGNVHEWVSDSPNPNDPRYGAFLGGFFADGSENGEGCSYRTTAHFKSYHDYSTGFRCCKGVHERESAR
jgi:formylglycine-generating enzyme